MYYICFSIGLSVLVQLAVSQSVIEYAVLVDLATETSKYLFPRRFEPRNFEEALMSGNITPFITTTTVDK